MLKRSLWLLLASSLVASGCAPTIQTRMPQSAATDSTMQARMVDYVQRLPIGSHVRVERTTGGALHGTLIGATADHVVVQRATRIPEPPVDVPLNAVTRIEIEERTGIGKGIIIGAAVGAAATFGFLILVATALGG